MFYSWLFPTFKADNPHLKGSKINQVQLTTSCAPVVNVNMDLKCQFVAKSQASNLCSSADRLQCVPLISAHTNNLALQFWTQYACISFNARHYAFCQAKVT